MCINTLHKGDSDDDDDDNNNNVGRLPEEQDAGTLYELSLPLGRP
jgi:hypothetical protein